jgi:hypothetical protein
MMTTNAVWPMEPACISFVQSLENRVLHSVTVADADNDISSSQTQVVGRHVAVARFLILNSV